MNLWRQTGKRPLTIGEACTCASIWVADWNTDDLYLIMTRVTLRCADSEAHAKSVRVIVNER
jgi:hypothetical protein